MQALHAQMRCAPPPQYFDSCIRVGVGILNIEGLEMDQEQTIETAASVRTKLAIVEAMIAEGKGTTQ